MKTNPVSILVKVFVRIVLAAALVSGSHPFLSAAAAGAESLRQDFAHPPASFKPWAYFFFENDTMDPAGITADLEALASAGVGGLLVFSEHRRGMKMGNVKMFSKEYDAGIRHLLKEASRLGLVLSFHNCAGSATAGGPWNSVEQSMKMFVWSETRVAGGGERAPKLPQPFTIGGFYRDIAVMAYPVGPAVQTATKPKITAPKGTGNPGEMMDGDIVTNTLFRDYSEKEKREILLEYPEPVTVGRLFGYGKLSRFRHDSAINFDLEASDDGKTWRKIAGATQTGDNSAVADFPEVTGKHFRILAHILASVNVDNFWISELDLLPPGASPAAYPEFNDWAAATGREKGTFDRFKPMLIGEDKPLDPARAVDLTSKMKPDGSLSWDAPPGDWLVLRMGYTTTGKKNHPSTGEGQGYEVDKLDPVLVRRHAEEALRRMTGGGLGSPALKMFNVDSWEAGGQNWTENLAAEFERRNGYSLLPFLPVLGAKLVGDADTTRRFLEDFRHTIRDLVSENFYGVMQDVSKKHGLAFLAQASAGHVPIHRPLDYFDYVDIPMGEAWALGNFTSNGNISGGLRDTVSAAHLLGKPVTPVEIFTSNRGDWNMAPRYLKAFGDKILAAGGNQFVLHCYIHQPSGDPAPGWTMTRFGTTFNRHVTWWKQAGPWLKSIARSQVMLRQGRTVADFCRLLGDDESIVNPDFADRQIFWDAPTGYANDWAGRKNLLRQFTVDNGEIVAPPGGARYRLLVLPDREVMTLEVVKKLRELVEAGGAILGPKPTARGGLQGGKAADKEFSENVTALWGTDQDRRVGKGRVLTGMTVDAALDLLGVKPDLSWTTADKTPEIFWHHRTDGERDIYFLANGGGDPLRATFSFRTAGRAPEIWNPVTGMIRKPAVFCVADGRTEIPLELTPSESVFVVFGPDPVGTNFASVSRDGTLLWPCKNEPAPGFPDAWIQPDGTVVVETSVPGTYAFENPQKKIANVTVPALPEPLTLNGPWKVSFDGVAKPPPQVFERLVPWNTHPDPAVRFFSGTAEYRQEFTLPEGMLGANRTAWLDLGEVRELAEVSLNGKPLGIVWAPPFRLDVTKTLRPGKNEIVIRAVNTWANRLIGDAALPETERQTWTSFVHYKKGDKIPDSGLLGPVTLRTAAKIAIKP